MRAVAQAISAVAAGTNSSHGNSVSFNDKGGRNGTASTPKLSNPPAPMKTIAASAVPTIAASRAEVK